MTRSDLALSPRARMRELGPLTILDGDSTDGVATVPSVPSRDVAVSTDSLESSLELLDAESDDDDCENDCVSAVSCSDGDFEPEKLPENLCWDHFGVLKPEKSDCANESNTGSEKGSSSNGLRSCLRKESRHEEDARIHRKARLCKRQK